MKISIPHLWIGGMLLGMGTAAAFTYRSCDAETEIHFPTEKKPQLSTSSSEQPSLFTNLEEKIRIIQPPENNTVQNSQQTIELSALRGYLMHHVINNSYTFERFADTMENYIDGGKTITVKALRDLLADEELEPKLSKLFGSSANLVAYVESFAGREDNATLGQFLGYDPLASSSIEDLCSDLWANKGGKKIWERYRESAFLSESAAASFQSIKESQKLPIQNLEEYMVLLAQLYSASGFVPLTVDQMASLREAAQAYDRAAHHFATVHTRVPQPTPEEYELEGEQLYELEGIVYRAAMSEGEVVIFSDIARSIENNDLANFFRLGYYRNVLRGEVKKKK